MLSSGLAAGLALKLSSANSAALGLSALADPNLHPTAFYDAHQGDASFDPVPSHSTHGPGHVSAQDLKDMEARVDTAFNINAQQKEALFDEAKDTIIKARSALLSSSDASAAVSQASTSSSTPASFLSSDIDGSQVHSPSSTSSPSHPDATGQVGKYLKDMEAKVDEAFNINAKQKEALFDEAKDTIIKVRSAILGNHPAEVSQAFVGLVAPTAFLIPVATGSDTAAMLPPRNNETKAEKSCSQVGTAALLIDKLGLTETAQALRMFTTKYLVCSFGKEKGFRTCDPRSA